MKKSTGVKSEPERSFASGSRRGRRLVCPAERSSALTAAGLSPGRPDEGVWAYVCTLFRPRVPSPQLLRAVSREPTPAPVFGARTGADQSEEAIVRPRLLPPR